MIESDLGTQNTTFLLFCLRSLVFHAHAMLIATQSPSVHPIHIVLIDSDTVSTVDRRARQACQNGPSSKQTVPRRSTPLPLPSPPQSNTMFPEAAAATRQAVIVYAQTAMADAIREDIVEQIWWIYAIRKLRRSGGEDKW
jgi:hypothetical protein